MLQLSPVAARRPPRWRSSRPAPAPWLLTPQRSASTFFFLLPVRQRHQAGSAKRHGHLVGCAAPLGAGTVAARLLASVHASSFGTLTPTGLWRSVIAMERSTLVHRSRRGASAPRLLRGAQALTLVVSRPSCNDASAAFGWSDFLVCGSCLVSPLPLRLSLGLAFPSWSSALRLSSWSRLLIPRLSSGLSFFGFRLVSPPHSAAFVWSRLANLGGRSLARWLACSLAR